MRVGLLTNIGLTLDLFFPPLVDQWDRLGWEVIPAAGSSSRSFDNKVLRGVTRRPSLSNWAAPNELANWARTDKLDVIITNNATTSTLSRIWKLPVPVVYFCHGLHWDTGRSPSERVWRAIEGALIRNTSAVLTMNSDDYSWFSGQLPSDRILFLKGGVGVPLDVYPRMDLPTRPPLRLLWAGEFTSRKRPNIMLDIAELLQRRGVHFSLSMLGDGALWEQSRQRVQSSSLREMVELPGRQPLPDWMMQSHLMVHTSEWEGLPRVLLEGYATGRRAVAFDVKGVRDIPSVMLVPNNDLNAFSDAIVKTATTPQNLVGHDDDVTWLDTAYVAGAIRDFVERVVRSE